MTVVPSKYAPAKNDLYQTPSWATRALLQHISVRGLVVWEPCAGCHQMADVLREVGGADVITSDIETYSRPHDFLFNFLGSFNVSTGKPFDAVVSNPPYGKQNRDAETFARRALDRCRGTVAMLGTAKFDFGKTRADLFADNARFACKIALTDRVNWFAGIDGLTCENDNSESHAWYVWAPAHGPQPAAPRLLYAGRAQ